MLNNNNLMQKKDITTLILHNTFSTFLNIKSNIPKNMNALIGKKLQVLCKE